MCAIIGFMRQKSGVDVAKAIDAMAAGNVSRGPHAFGFAWVDDRGRLKSYRSAGRITDHRGMLLKAASEAVAFIGHMRWATHGDPHDNINNHPHPADGGWIVHNGVVSNYQKLVVSRRLNPVSECDSEAIGLLIERQEGTLARRCGDAINQTEGSLAMLGLWTRPVEMVVARRGNPLNLSTSGAAVFFATLPEGMPGRPTGDSGQLTGDIEPDTQARSGDAPEAAQERTNMAAEPAQLSGRVKEADVKQLTWLEAEEIAAEAVDRAFGFDAGKPDTMRPKVTKGDIRRIAHNAAVIALRGLGCSRARTQLTPVQHGARRRRGAATSRMVRGDRQPVLRVHRRNKSAFARFFPCILRDSRVSYSQHQCPQIRAEGD